MTGIRIYAPIDNQLTENGSDIVNAAEFATYLSNNSNIVEAATSNNFPIPGEAKKIYVALDTNTIYRWNGSSYAQLALSNAESQLLTNLNAEITSRVAADSTITSNLATEVTARTNADTTLQLAVDTEVTARIAADATLQLNIDAEVTARTEADATLQINIDTEVTARIAADATLQSAVDTEVSIRNGADANLQYNINTEASDRANADTTLRNSIATEATARTNADTTLQAEIDAEATSRTNADTTLQAEIDAEASARIAADNTLTVNLNAEASARAAADTSLQNTIDSLGAVFNYAGTVEGEVSAQSAYDLNNLTNKSPGDYYKVTTAGYFKIGAGGTPFYANVGDGLVWNNIGSVDRINNTNAQIQMAVNGDVDVQGSSDTGYTVDLTSTFKTRVSGIEQNILTETTARINADALLIPLTQKAQANGVATLDAGGDVPLSQIPNIALTTKTANYTVQALDHVILANGIITVTLPTAASVAAGKVYIVKRISDAGPVTVNVTSGGTIDGNTSVQITLKYASIDIVSDGSAWWII